MSLTDMPFWALLFSTFLLVLLAAEAGYRVARHTYPQPKTDGAESTIAVTILTLLGFILALTFNIVSDRYEARFQLVREEANIIGTAWLRTDFLPEAERRTTRELLRQYTAIRIETGLQHQADKKLALLKQSSGIQQQLWDIAAAQARLQPLSQPLALYVEVLNELIDIQSTRVATSLQTWIPATIWSILFLLIFLGVFSLGYQFGVIGAGRSWSTGILAFTLALTVILIAALDRPATKYVRVPQKPLIQLLESMQ